MINNIDSLAVAKLLLRVKSDGKVCLGSESENVLQILSELIQVVANIAKDHTNEYTDNGTPLKTKSPINRASGDFGGEKGGVEGLKGRLDPVIEVI